MRQASKRIPESAEKTVRDIRRATRRHHSAEEKIRIVLEGLREEVSIARTALAAAPPPPLWQGLDRSSSGASVSGFPFRPRTLRQSRPGESHASTMRLHPFDHDDRVCAYPL